jgi:DNA-directed RNA polymerase, alpha subunit/40 kD subunit
MPIRYGRFEMPKTLTKDESTATDTYAKFTAEPFEAGYGHTVGNSLPARPAFLARRRGHYRGKNRRRAARVRHVARRG